MIVNVDVVNINHQINYQIKSVNDLFQSLHQPLNQIIKWLMSIVTSIINQSIIELTIRSVTCVSRGNRLAQSLNQPLNRFIKPTIKSNIKLSIELIVAFLKWSGGGSGGASCIDHATRPRRKHGKTSRRVLLKVNRFCKVKLPVLRFPGRQLWERRQAGLETFPEQVCSGDSISHNVIINGCRKSTPPQNRHFTVAISNSKR